MVWSIVKIILGLIAIVAILAGVHAHGMGTHMGLMLFGFRGDKAKDLIADYYEYVKKQRMPLWGIIYCHIMGRAAYAVICDHIEEKDT